MKVNKKNIIRFTLLIIVAVICVFGFNVSSNYEFSREVNSKYVNSLSINSVSIIDWIKGLFGGGDSSSSDSASVRITSDTVCSFIKTDSSKTLSDYCSEDNLHADVHYASEKTDNWALLVHGNSMSGDWMYSALGDMYMDNNINILAIDLRGFGDSDGSVALGFLESLDVYDWLDYLVEKQGAKKIIIHGISLGGATTIQTLTLGGVYLDGVGTLPSISSKNVVGVVDDCGYTSMTGIIKGLLSLDDTDSSTDNSSSSFETGANTLFGSNFNVSGFSSLKENGANLGDTVVNGIIKTLLTGDLIKTGLNSDNFDRYQDSFGNGRTIDKNVKVMIVHGQGDTMVSPKNATTLSNNAGSNVVETFYPDGAPHAFIVVGQNKSDYVSHLNSFVNKLNMSSSSSSNGSSGESSSSSSGFLGGIIDFFKGLFS